MEDNKDKRGEIMSFEDRKIQTQFIHQELGKKKKLNKLNGGDQY